MGAGVDAGPENVSPMAETVPEAMNRKESDMSEEPRLPNASSSLGTHDSDCVNPKVPSKDPHSTTTLHMEDPERNSTTLPSVEENNVKQISTGISDILSEYSDTENKSKNSNSLTENSDSKTISSDQYNTSSENGGANASESSGGISWRSEGESALPSMGILPDVERTPDQGAQFKRPQPPDVAAQCAASSSAAHSPETHAVDPSDVVHKIKKIKWQDIEVPIITQNNNGPCPLIAIVNVMILKGQITLPADRTEITGGDLVLVVGNALFDQPRNSLPSDMRRHVEQNTEDAISILHKLLTGLDVNVKFSGVRDFEFTGELCIFDLLGIMLYHGWVVDPSSEAATIIKHLSYNQLTNNIFAWREEAVKNNNNDLLVKAMLCEEFMANSGSQLTIHGLFELGSALRREEIAVLFRNNHFSTIYKREDQLYQLLTDQGFLHENMVWETLNDVDATFSEFVNGNFETIPPAPEPSTSSSDLQNMTLQQQINSDQQLAAMLQREVDEQQRQQQNFERLKDSLGLHNLSDEEMAKKLQEEENRLAAEDEAEVQPSRQATTVPPSVPTPIPQHNPQPQEDKKKKECVIL
ncbi:ubiquitin carboxyl-terminal hydrolase MINDY-1-like isoform X2 [Portunus trituberculatus]|nr:ubiquitin carboxyl-terminal hydrolase MINDY-1-like isoform X2 [Portunus trituberculatus]